MKKILVVDNHPVVLKLLVDFLHREGHEVLTAEDGLAALEILKKTAPDIVITDLIMPNINGEKLCQVIRSRPELKAVRLIIYSATLLEDESNILKLGADACIAKGPFKNTEAHLATVLRRIDNNSIGELSGVILGGEDLYKRHITSELLFSRRHYEIIFDSMPEGVIEFTFDGRIFHANASALTLTGLPEEDLLASGFLDLFGAGQRERLRALLAGIEEAPAFIEEKNPILLNGKKVAINFLPIRDEEHEFIVAIMRDLSDKIKTEKAFSSLRHQHERILNAVGEGIFGIDSQNRITFANPAALAMLGYEHSKIVGNSLHDIVHSCPPQEEENPPHACPICAAGRDGILRKGTETFWRKDGSSFPVRFTSTPIAEDFALMGAVVTFADITERKKWEEKLRESVVTDELTGLLNRRGFMAFSEKLLGISNRDGIDLLLFYIDFDNMKWINDTLGHQIGDQALVETAILLRDTFRLADVIGRIGGDEFVILCTDNSALGNETSIAHRLAENLARINSDAARQYPLSLSFGVARYSPAAACSIGELLSRADRAMYASKEEKKKQHTDGYQH